MVQIGGGCISLYKGLVLMSYGQLKVFQYQKVIYVLDQKRVGVIGCLFESTYRSAVLMSLGVIL